jgi:hypothetical protein
MLSTTRMPNPAIRMATMRRVTFVDKFCFDKFIAGKYTPDIDENAALVKRIVLANER